MDPNILSHGSLNELENPIRLKAGELTMNFERGFLSFIRCGEIDIIREINYLIRDHDWGTLPMTIISQKVEANDDHFSIQYTATCKKADINYLWNCKIIGNKDSSIIFEVKGKAISSFVSNRIGMTILHPANTCKGKKCLITQPNGDKVQKQFPELVAPHQPFFDIKKMEWSPDNGVKASLSFEGQIFETEDQRNWTDLSFKTYCPPLDPPYSKDIIESEEINHQVTLSIENSNQPKKDISRPVTLSIGDSNAISFPKVGLSYNSLTHSPWEIEQLKKLNIDYLRVELDGNKENISYFNDAKDLCVKINCLLEVVLIVDDKIEESLLENLHPYADHILHFVILKNGGPSTSQALIDNSLPIIKKYFPNKNIGGGTDGFYADLNRNRTPADDLDFLTFSLNPQVHAFDNDAVMETFLGQRDIAKSCLKLASGKKFAVGPISFKVRKAANEFHGTEQEKQDQYFNYNVDPRQLSLFGANWLLGSFKNLVENGASFLTYFQTTGWLGLMSNDAHLWPAKYDITSNSVYPIYLMLIEILKLKGQTIVPLISSAELVVNGICCEDAAGKTTILLGNLTNKRQDISINNCEEFSTIKTIDTNNIKALLTSPDKLDNLIDKTLEGLIIIPPFAIVKIEL